jgi:small neutral amino acid transporter SnatA (MarC family)
VGVVPLGVPLGVSPEAEACAGVAGEALLADLVDCIVVSLMAFIWLLGLVSGAIMRRFSPDARKKCSKEQLFFFYPKYGDFEAMKTTLVNA